VQKFVEEELGRRDDLEYRIDHWVFQLRCNWQGLDGHYYRNVRVAFVMKIPGRSGNFDFLQFCGVE
jgi:hypothetical protein